MRSKIVVLVCLICGLFCFFSCTPEEDTEMEVMSVQILPKPARVVEGEGLFILSGKTKIVNDLGSEGDLSVAGLQQQMKDLHGLKLKAKNRAGENVIRLTTEGTDKELGPEGYQLEVLPEGITIRANAGAGLFYGMQTLLQLLEPGNKRKKLAVPVVTVVDQPRFKWRGMHLDVCRHFFPVEFVKKYLDIMALHKMNVFHWHLTEDQGWRMEIKKYPKLTEISAWRVDREHLHWNERPAQEPGEKATYGGFYTQDEAREIIQYAADRYITVVPEIELPGHAVAALAAYPELSCTGGPFSVIPGGYWPITNIYCAGKDSVFKFLENVLDEVADLFPGEFLHIGGDEAHKANWEKCPDCQARIKAEGLKDEHELQSYFIKRIEKFLISKNKKLIGWDEILEGGLAPEAAVMSWRGMDGGIAASKAGHDVVMSPTTHCYLDYYQDDDREKEPVAIGGYLPLEKVYSFDPMPPDLAEDKQHHILGAQGNVWTEYMPNGNHVEYMALPRMSAIAEGVWSPKDLRDIEDFKQRLLVHYGRLDARDINYRDHETGEAAKPTPKTYYTE